MWREGDSMCGGSTRNLVLNLPVLAVLALLVVPVLRVQVAHGEMIVVDNLVDSLNGSCTSAAAGTGSCNLRAGVNFCLNSTVFAAETETCTLMLTAGMHVVTEGQMSLDTSSNLRRVNITGSQALATTIEGSGNGGRRWLRLGSPRIVLSLEDVTVQGFSDTTGGAIYLNQTANCSFTRVSFQNNHATSYGGGAVALDDSNRDTRFAEVTCRNSTALFVGGCIMMNWRNTGTNFERSNFDDSVAQYGGALYLGSKNNHTRFENCSWSQNAATANGGALHVNQYHTDLTVLTSRFYKNTAHSSGGGFMASRRNTEFQFFDTEFTENHANFYGGGMYIDSHNSDFTFSGVMWRNNSVDEPGAGGGTYISQFNDKLQFLGGCEWVANFAYDGGGAYLYSDNGVVFENTSFSENFALNDAGGLYLNEYNVNVTMTRCAFTSNVAVNFGGGLYSNSNNKALNATNCTWAKNVGATGAGVYVNSGAHGAHFTSCLWDANAAALWAGGIIISQESYRVTFDDCVWRKNNGTSSAGGIALYANAKEANFRRCVFEQNRASSGAGVYMYSGNDDASFMATSFKNNVGTVGVAMYISTNNFFTYLTNCSFASNYARDTAGGLYMGDGNWFMTADHTTWSNNTALQYAGAIGMGSENSYQTFVDCVFDSNTALDSGGALWLQSANLGQKFTRCLFTKNQAILSGGAVRCDSGNRDIEFIDCSFTSHYAQTGGALHFNQQNIGVELVRVFASGNSAATNGGFLYARADNSDFVLDTCTFVENTASSTGGAIASVLSSTHMVVRDSHFVNNSGGYGGAVALGEDDQWQLWNSTWVDNEANIGGGAINVDDAEVVALVDCEFRGNSVLVGSGGAISVTGDSRMVVPRGVFLQNHAATDGGALSVSASKVYLRNVTIRDNRANNNGGGVGADSESIVFLGQIPLAIQRSLNNVFNSTEFNFSGTGGAKVLGNTAVLGGGIHTDASTLVLSHSTVADNVATNAGAGLLLSSSTVFTTNSSLNGNRVRNTDASSDVDAGGGVYVASGTSLVQLDTILRNNSAAFGGGLSIDYDAAMVSGRCNFSFNEAEVDGGGLFISSPSAILTQLFLECNTARTGGGGGLFWDWTTIGVLRNLDTNLATTGNQARYGPDVATPVYRLTAVRSVSSTSGARIPTPLNATVVDWYNQTVASYGASHDAKITVEAGANCSNPQLAGTTVQNFAGGVATFDDISVTCDPGSTVLSELSVADTDLGYVFTTSTDFSLRQCRLGQVVSSKVCLTCGLGEYAWEGFADCKSCLAHSSCPMSPGWAVDVRAGYWRHDNFSSRVRRCPAEDACEGGTNTDTQCASGSSGPLCMVCEPGYFDHSAGGSGECTPCNSASRYTPLVILLSIVLMGSMAALWLCHRRPQCLQSVKAVRGRVSFRVYWKVVFAYFQLTTQFNYIFAVAYPSSYTTTNSALSIANLGFSQLFAPHCYDSHYNFYDTLVGQTAGALIVALLVHLCYVVRSARAATADRARQLRLRAMRLLLLISYIVFPGTSTTIFQAFSCDSDFDDGNSYLKADYSISCKSREYQKYVWYASVMVLVFPVGIMAAYAYVLWTHRHSICPRTEDIVAATANPTTLSTGGEVDTDRQTNGAASGAIAQLVGDLEQCEGLLSSVQHSVSTRKQVEALQETKRRLQYEFRDQDRNIEGFSFLYEAYKPELYFMEVLECVRRILMSSAIVFVPKTDSQLVLAMLICVFFILLYGRIRPFMHEVANRLMISVLWCVLLQLFVTLMLFEDVVTDSALVGLVLVAALFVGPLLPILGAAWMLRHTVRQAQEEGVGPSTIALKLLKSVAGIRESTTVGPDIPAARPNESTAVAQNEDATVATINPLADGDKHEL